MRTDPRPRVPLIDRFRALVGKPDADGCWPWLGKPDSYGYGRISEGGRGGRMLRAHRVSWEVHVGPIPDDHTIDHLCGNKRCVNPAHLEPVSASENLTRRHAKQTHCQQGHPLSGDNLYVNPSGSRVCITCAYAAHKRWRDRKKATPHQSQD